VTDDGGDRLDVRKTYKLYVGGEFPRSESGRSFPVRTSDGVLLANAVLGSRKDLRDAVKAARGAQAGWAARTAYNRAQVLYRVAEVMEGRRSQFVAELVAGGGDDPDGEVDEAIDRWVWYAGWADKLPAVLGGANAVAGPYFNFTVPEPTGVVGLIAPDEAPLLALVSRLAPIVVSGNTVVALASEALPLPAITLGEALATSDVPGGVINLLTGKRAELVPWFAGHRDVNALDLTGVDDPELAAEAERAAAESVMRVTRATGPETEWRSAGAESPYMIEAFLEHKTVWHPKGA
jgi:acyl-CoA reductase-like NAD-dependent aldehyde dehydrogenase